MPHMHLYCQDSIIVTCYTLVLQITLWSAFRSSLILLPRWYLVDQVSGWSLAMSLATSSSADQVEGGHNCVQSAKWTGLIVPDWHRRPPLFHRGGLPVNMEQATSRRTRIAELRHISAATKEVSFRNCISTRNCLFIFMCSVLAEAYCL